MDDKKFKHLDYIYNTINRMSTNSFIIKGWLITLISAIFVLSDNTTNQDFLYISILTIPVFWYLNAFFLKNERKYRKLYDDVRILNEDSIDFSMDTKEIKGMKYTLFSSLFSKSIWPLYLNILAINIILIYIYHQ
jgi:hypothetical protein